MEKGKSILMNAPYYSQWLDVKDPDWQRRSCGIVALKMAMEFLGGAVGSLKLDNLIKEGLALPNAYDTRFGWVHDGLIALATTRGFKSSFRKEWQLDGRESALWEISASIENRLPVLASVKSPTGGHLILLIGFEKESDKIKGFYCHDPDAKIAEEGRNKFIPISVFLEIWKGRIIVVKK